MGGRQKNILAEIFIETWPFPKFIGELARREPVAICS